MGHQLFPVPEVIKTVKRKALEAAEVEKGGGKGTKGKTKGDSPASTRCQMLSRLLEDDKAMYGEGHPVVKQVEADLSEAKALAEQDEALAMASSDPQGLGSMLRIKRQLQRATAKLEKRRSQLVDAEEKFKQARATLEEAKANVATAEWHLDTLEQQAAAITTASAKSPGANGQDFQTKSAQLAELIRRLESAPDVASALAEAKSDMAKLEEHERKLRQIKSEQMQIQTDEEAEESPADDDDDVSLEELTAEEEADGESEGFRPVESCGRKRLTKAAGVGSASSSSVQKKTKGASRG